MLYAVFARSESLAQAVQSPKLSLAKADSMVKALPSMWNSDRCDCRFAVLWDWDTVVREADSLGVDPPVMPRVRVYLGLVEAIQGGMRTQRCLTFHR